jgi:hypothetical protein
MVENGKYNKKK